MAFIQGTSGADTFSATSAEGDFIIGLQGNDTINGGPGVDTLNGNENDDVLLGSGNDNLFGGQGNDTIFASNIQANDTLSGNKGNDLLIGSTAESPGVVMFGGQGNDTLYGQNAGLLFGDLGDDLLFSNGNTTLVGGGANSTLGLNDGNDTLVGGAGSQLMIGGAGGDKTYVFQPAVNKTIGGRSVVEGGFGGLDVIRGFRSGAGNDVISFRGLVSGDIMTLININAGMAISFQESPDSSAARGQAIVVEGANFNVLLGSQSGDLLVNGTAVVFDPLNLNTLGDVYTFRVT